MRLCSLDDCTKPVVAKGLCENHYRRMKRNGDPTIHVNKPWGEARTITTAGYVKITRNGKQVFEHRYNVEQHLGRPLTSDEIIHHKDGNKLNNDLNNLVVTNSRRHKAFHCSELVRVNGKIVPGVRGTPNKLSDYMTDTLKKED